MKVLSKDLSMWRRDGEERADEREHKLYMRGRKRQGVMVLKKEQRW